MAVLTPTAAPKRSRIWAVAAALVLMLEGGNLGVYDTEAFCLPSGIANPRGSALFPNDGDETRSRSNNNLLSPLGSFKFIKGETSYGDISDGSINNGLLGGTSSTLGTNSLSAVRRNRQSNRITNANAWWNRGRGFSRSTPTTLLAAGSIESWPVMEADDLQVLVKKGDDEEEWDNKGRNRNQNSKSSSKQVRATLERWERDISLEVVGHDGGGYPMLGNQMQPGSNNNYNSGNNSDKCTQSIKFDVANGDVYPFSGSIEVPPPLTIQDSMGNQQKTVMMVMNNPDDENENGNFGLVQQEYDEYGNPMETSKPKKASVEARVEPLYKSPDEKYAQAQQKQLQQQVQYDEYGNEIYNPNSQSRFGNNNEDESQKTTIPSQGSQSFELDATDPATGKIKISLERGESGGGFGGQRESSTEAHIEIRHGFRDQYGNSYSDNNDFWGGGNSNNGYEEEKDRRISLEVSTLHPTFSSVVDTMPTNLLAKHTLPSAANNDLSFVRPYLEVRIVNTGSASVVANVQSYLPQYRPSSKKEKDRREKERQQYERRQQLLQMPGQNQVRANDPFLLVDSAQSSTGARRMKNTQSFRQKEASFVDASSRNGSFGAAGPSINEIGAPNNNQRFPQRNGQSSFDAFNSNGSFGSSSNGAYRQERFGNTNGGNIMADSRLGGDMGSSQSSQQSYGYGSNAYGSQYTTIGYANGGNIEADSRLGSDKNFVEAQYRNTGRQMIQPRISSEYYNDSYNNYDYNNNYYDGAIDTIATPKGFRSPSSGLEANNDFTAANGKSSSSNSRNNRYYGKTSGVIPGYDSNGFREAASDDSTKSRLPSIGVPSFGGNSGNASGMQQPFQGRSMQTPSRGRQSYNNRNNNVIGGPLQQTFGMQTNPTKTRKLPSRSQSGRSSSAFDNVIDVDLGGRNGSNSRSRNMNNRNSYRSGTPQPSNAFGNRGDIGGSTINEGFGINTIKQRLEENDSMSRRMDTMSRGRSNSNQRRGNYGGRSMNNFNNDRNNSFDDDRSFGSNNYDSNNYDRNSQRTGGNPFGNLGSPPQTKGNSKNPFSALNGEKTQQSNNNNAFGGSRNRNDNGFNRNNNGFSDSQNNGGNPFGNLGSPPQTEGNSNNPFSSLNGNNNNNSFGGNSNSNNSFGGMNGGGGAPQRPLSPSPSARTNPFAGLNGKGNNGPGGSSTTAMRSLNTFNGMDDDGYYEDENPVVGFAKNIARGIGGFGKQ